jgi:hypothetical protein
MKVGEQATQTQTPHDRGDHTAEECPLLNVPQERVFLEVKFFLDQDNRPMGGLQYHGGRLKALKVSKALGLECRLLSELVDVASRQAISEAGMTAHLAGIFIGEEDESGDKDDNDTGTSV